VSADLDCIQVVELITDYLDGVLDAATAADVEAHLADCPGCGAYLDQIRTTVVALGHVPIDTLSPQAQADLLAAFRSFPRPPLRRDQGRITEQP
jgi:anti-sigma factor RsiW